ncbi:MAG: hypothetical protein M3453_11165 [Pseudomonadota bacterium]|nr:hypothetical protein [Pseudomonadota bacterium]
MDRRMIVPPSMENIVQHYRYAPGMLVNDILFVSGQVGRDENLRWSRTRKRNSTSASAILG